MKVSLCLQQEMDQLTLQYKQLCDDYEAVKTEPEATQNENQRLTEHFKQSSFGFDSLKHI